MDPIADMLTQIRNAQAVKKATVDVPFSNLKYEIIKILEGKGLIEKIEKRKKEKKTIMKITLKYKDGVPVIHNLRRVSKPGQRIYLPFQKIKLVQNGYGVAIISTSKGLMTDQEARKQKLGGEVICEMW